MDYSTAVDQTQLNFNPESIILLNIVIGLMMLGVAFDIKISDFKRIALEPKAPVIGLIAQFLLLPALTFLLTLVIKPAPSMALGMILIAACPGGNLSNIVTYLAKGNAAVSVSMTAVSTAIAVILTPANLAFWGSLNPATAAILKKVSLSPFSVFTTIVIILGIPLCVGMTLAHFCPKLVDKIRKPFRIFSFLGLVCFVAVALVANWAVFLEVIGLVFAIVLLHNLTALNIGYWFGRLFKLEKRDLRAVTIEVGTQNSALGLILIFDFFNGLGGMAIVAAFWGTWHIVSGICLALYWSRVPIAVEGDVI
jgi:BASS family bile acid:Na+ symporter